MRRIAFGGLLAALSSCVANSELQLGGAPPVTGGGSGPQKSQSALIPPGDAFLPLLSGHRLAAHGGVIAVADPEGQAADGRAPGVYLVSSSNVRRVALPDGARPMAVELDAAGATAWVLLEGSGGIASIDTGSATVSAFYAMCRAPADLALEGDAVWVACRSGEVVKLEGGALHTFTVPGVPTNIAASAGEVFVARADATVVSVGAGSVGRISAPAAQQVAGLTMLPRQASPNTPRRLVALPGGRVTLLHQQSLEGELSPSEATGPVGMGGEGGASPYSGGACDSPAARGVVTAGNGTNGAFNPSVPLAATLPIDEAMSPSGGQVAVADPATGRVMVVSTALPIAGIPAQFDCVAGRQDDALHVPGASSVTYDDSGQLLVLGAADQLSIVTFGPGGDKALATVLLRARTVPEGFTLFHSTPRPEAPAKPNVACASCHPAGLNNGATLTVGGVKHKVMTLGGHGAGAAGVHWGDESFQVAVVEGTWKTNMQGTPLTQAQAASLKAFIAQLGLPAAPSGNVTRVAQGRAAFDKAGCAGCHDPSRHFTNDSRADVGRGMHRVPSLAGLAYSAPYMSDGCAATLAERFSKPACGGGELHGHPGALTAAELEALLGFLQTL